jgi:hypothetical protein
LKKSEESERKKGRKNWLKHIALYHSRIHWRWNSCLQLVTCKARDKTELGNKICIQYINKKSFIEIPCENVGWRGGKWNKYDKLLPLRDHFHKNLRGKCYMHHHMIPGSPLPQMPQLMSYELQVSLLHPPPEPLKHRNPENSKPLQPTKSFNTQVRQVKYTVYRIFKMPLLCQRAHAMTLPNSWESLTPYINKKNPTRITCWSD